MASILDKYGIKEVADVTFYTITDTGEPGNPVLYLDSLKVSTLEQTAESVYAEGGKGNARLIGWDFGKNITLNIEDALFSMKSMAIMFGDGTVTTSSGGKTKKTIQFTATSTSTDTSSGAPTQWTDITGKTHAISKAVFTDEVGATATSFTKGNRYFATFDIDVDKQTIRIGPDTFPGTYYIEGDTYCRSESSGADEYFKFIVYKGKVLTENTITMEASGDPSVFNMSVEALRATTQEGEKVMVDILKYTPTA